MPLKGHIVHCRGWFRFVEAELQHIGFKRCPSPTGSVSPGFYHFERAGYREQRRDASLHWVVPRNRRRRRLYFNAAAARRIVQVAAKIGASGA